MGGRGYKHVDGFTPHASKTVCDVTGFEVTTDDVVRRWEGLYVIPAAFTPRQPQDFPVVPQKQVIYKEARSEQVNPSEEAQLSITPL